MKFLVSIYRDEDGTFILAVRAEKGLPLTITTREI